MYIERFGQTIKNIVPHSLYLFVPVGATFYCCHGSRLPNEYLMLNSTDYKWPSGYRTENGKFNVKFAPHQAAYA